MTWTLLRWGSRLIGKPLRSHTVMAWSLWAFAFVQADVIVDWGRLRDASRRSRPGWLAWDSREWPWWGPMTTLGLGSVALVFASRRLEHRRNAR